MPYQMCSHLYTARYVSHLMKHIRQSNSSTKSTFFNHFSPLFQSLRHVREHAISNVDRNAVGNKNDDANQKVVITEDAKRFATQMEIQLFETSAKDNINVEEMFLAITEKVLRHKLDQNAQNAKDNNDKIKILPPRGNKKKNKCC